MSGIKNPAPAALTTTVVHTDSGDVAMPCEPINEYLAITTEFGMDADGKTWLLGGFVITHRPTGLRVSEGAGCIECCRASGRTLDALAADWATLTDTNGAEWTAALDDDTKANLAIARAVEWGCDVELCQHPGADRG